MLSFLCYIRAGAVPQLGTRPPSSAITSVATIASAVNTSPLVTTVPVTPTGTNAAGSQTSVLAVTNALTTPTATRGTILSTSLQPVSARLTRRILAGEFVEMRDLLVDNMALYDQLESLHGQLMIGSTPGVLRTRLREVPSLNILGLLLFGVRHSTSHQSSDVRHAHLLSPHNQGGVTPWGPWLAGL